MDPSVAEQTASVVNVAASLEPLAGAALAINLAYLGLQRFRYREKIRAAAESERKIFEHAEKTAPENIKAMRYYAQLRDLCSLSNHDLDDIPGANKDARINNGFWSAIYHHLYRKHRDRYIAYTGAGLAGVTLTTGVAVNIGTWSLASYLYSETSAPLWFYVLILACAAPISMVYVGRQIVFYAAGHAKECREEIEKAMQTKAQDIVIPVGVPVAPAALPAPASNGSPASPA